MNACLGSDRALPSQLPRGGISATIITNLFTKEEDEVHVGTKSEFVD